MSPIVEKLMAAVGLAPAMPPPTSPPVKYVRCEACQCRTPAGQPLEAVLARCPSCSRLAPLIEGEPDLFVCSGCDQPDRPDCKTYFALRNGEPFTESTIKRVVVQERPENAEWDERASEAFDQAAERWTPKGIRATLEGRRRELDARDEAGRLAVVRRCIKPECRKYCWPISDGVMTCEECKGQLHEVGEVKYCANERCEKSGAEVRLGYVPIVDGRCKYCGHPAARRHREVVR